MSPGAREEKREATSPNLPIQVNPNDYLQRGEYSLRWRLLELVAYINTSRRPNRREHSECRDSNVHGMV
jgi:hypothetical protein